MVININTARSNDIGLDTSRAVGEKEKAKKLVLIEWVDIISDDGWIIAEDCHLPTFYSVGWLEFEDDRVVKICNTLDFEDPLEEHKKKEKPIGYGVTCFPRGCVTSVTFLKT
tara:strand:- start:1632 stop:1967 length:336 start_codon:yes stop_codon:yes gene_type:complete